MSSPTQPDPPDGSTDSLSADELTKATVSGIRWLVLARVAVESITFASLLALTRILTPADFGRAAVALVIFGVAFSMKGFGWPLIQMPTIRRAHPQAAAAMSLGIGLVLSATTYLLAPVVATPIFGSKTSELVQLVAPCFLLIGLTAAPEGMINRRVDFRRLGITEAVSQLVGSGSSVGLAVAGFGGKALIGGVLILAGTSSVLLTLARPRVVPAWRPREMREILSYGSLGTLNAVVTALSSNVDYAILGAKLPPAEVGFYQRGYQIGIDYQGKLSGIMARIAFPIYSRSGDLQTMRAFHDRMVRAHGAVLLPLLGLFIAVAPEVVPWLYGGQWKSAVVPAQILALGGMAVALLVGWGPVLMATDRMGTLVRWNLVALLCFAALVFASVQFGLTAVCIGVAVFHLSKLLAVQQVIFGRLMQSGLRYFAREVMPTAICTLLLVTAAWTLERALSSIHVNGFVVVVVVLLVGSVVYIATLRVFFPAVAKELTVVAARVVPVRRLTARRKQAAPNAQG